MKALAEKMKMAGFPQFIEKGDLYLMAGQVWRASDPIIDPAPELTKIPSFSQIVEHMGEDFSSVMRLSAVEFVARSRNGRSATGLTPEEAAGNLYVVVNKRK